MYQKRKYKHFILLCLVLDLLTMVFLGYRYLDRKIPDEIHIDKNSGLDLSQISNLPFVSFGDTITTSGEGSYQLPCRLFGKIAFKNINQQRQTPFWSVAAQWGFTWKQTEFL